MMICRIDGAVHSTVQHSSIDGEKLLIAQPLTLDGAPSGLPIIAIDKAQAGPGDLCLVMREGGGARIVLENDRSPVQAIVIAVIDDVRLEPNEI